MYRTQKWLMGIVASLAIISCSDDELIQVAPAPVEARFTQTELTLAENDGPLEITISLAKPAIREGRKTRHIDKATSPISPQRKSHAHGKARL